MHAHARAQGKPRELPGVPSVQPALWATRVVGRTRARVARRHTGARRPRRLQLPKAGGLPLRVASPIGRRRRPFSPKPRSSRLRQPPRGGYLSSCLRARSPRAPKPLTLSAVRPPSIRRHGRDEDHQEDLCGGSRREPKHVWPALAHEARPRFHTAVNRRANDCPNDIPVLIMMCARPSEVCDAVVGCSGWSWAPRAEKSAAEV